MNILIPVLALLVGGALGFVIAKTLRKNSEQKADQKAKDILAQNREILEKTSKVLLERETITGHELTEILAGRDPFASTNKTTPTAPATPGSNGTGGDPLVNPESPIDPSFVNPQPAH